MNFQEYQAATQQTAIYPNSLPTLDISVIYTALGLVGEAGEVAGVIKKVIRDNQGNFDEESVAKLKKEIGDVLWYVARLCDELGLQLEDIAEANIQKLLDRKDRGVLQGSGDNR